MLKGELVLIHETEFGAVRPSPGFHYEIWSKDPEASSEPVGVVLLYQVNNVEWLGLMTRKEDPK